MKEILKIRNFACIQELEMEIASINILIGPQAVGKSVCIRLLYYFKNFLRDIFRFCLNKSTWKELEDHYLNKFMLFFPQTYSNHFAFYVSYESEDTYIRFSKSAGENKPVMECSDYYKRLFKETESIVRFNSETIITDLYLRDSWDSIDKAQEQFLEHLGKDLGEPAMLNQYYIPSSRSFFIQFRDLIFDRWSMGQFIDPFMVEFSKVYVEFKREFNRIYSSDCSQKEEMVSILRGRYIQEENMEFLDLINGPKLQMIHASSGQQEVLPITVLLSVLPYMEPIRGGNCLYTEEPEAHLFPTSQRDLVLLYAGAFNKSKSPVQLFITTHSPYILMAFSNLLHAGYLKKKLKKANLPELYKIVPEEFILDPTNLRAYSLNNGTAEDIRYPDSGLITADLIDDVSNSLSIDFGKLVEME